jgi:exodeoxyribonuclease VII small subunit
MKRLPKRNRINDFTPRLGRTDGFNLRRLVHAGFICKCLQRLKSQPMPKNTAPTSAADESLSYEAALQQLEALVARMDSGQMPLDELLSGYQRGAALLKICRDKLAAVEQQIKLLDEHSKA